MIPTTVPSPANPPVSKPIDIFDAAIEPPTEDPIVAMTNHIHVGKMLKSGKKPATSNPGIADEMTPIHNPMFCLAVKLFPIDWLRLESKI